MEKYLRIGIITTTHGVHGEVKVYPTTDDIKKLERITEVIAVRTDAEGNPEDVEEAAGRVLKIRSVKYFKGQAILGFEGIDTPEDASKLRHWSLMISREDSGEPGEDEYFISDLTGMDVYLEDSGTRYGVLTDVYQTAANDVYEITRDSDHKKILVPAIHECILNVDVENARMDIHLLPGLEDI